MVRVMDAGRVVVKQLAIRRMPTLGAYAQVKKDAVRRQQPVNGLPRVGVETRPSVVPRLIDHARSYRIELNVTLASQQVVVGLDETRTKTPLPQRTRTTIPPVDTLNVALPQPLHQVRDAVGRLAGDEQVNVFGHQNIGLDRNTFRGRGSGKRLEIEPEVVL